MNYWLLSVPLFTAFSGWLLNKLVLAILLRRRSGGWMEKKQQLWAVEISEYVSTKLFNPADITRKITDPAHYALVRPEIEQHIDDFLKVRLKEVFPMISMFIGEKTTLELKTHFMNELDQLFPQVIARYADSLVTGFSPGIMVRQQLENFDLNSFIRENLRKELRYFSLWGAVSGFITGIICLIIVCLSLD